MTLTTKQIKLTLAGAATFLAFLAPSLAFADETITYTVKPGDTLSLRSTTPLLKNWQKKTR